MARGVGQRRVGPFKRGLIITQADWKESEKAPRVIDKLRGGDGRPLDGLKANDKGKPDFIMMLMVGVNRYEVSDGF